MACRWLLRDSMIVSEDCSARSSRLITFWRPLSLLLDSRVPLTTFFTADERCGSCRGGFRAAETLLRRPGTGGLNCPGLVFSTLVSFSGCASTPGLGADTDRLLSFSAAEALPSVDFCSLKLSRSASFGDSALVACKLLVCMSLRRSRAALHVWLTNSATVRRTGTGSERTSTFHFFPVQKTK